MGATAKAWCLHLIHAVSSLVVSLSLSLKIRRSQDWLRETGADGLPTETPEAEMGADGLSTFQPAPPYRRASPREIRRITRSWKRPRHRATASQPSRRRETRRHLPTPLSSRLEPARRPPAQQSGAYTCPLFGSMLHTSQCYTPTTGGQGARARMWCLLTHADASLSLSHGGQGESLVPRWVTSFCH